MNEPTKKKKGGATIAELHKQIAQLKEENVKMIVEINEKKANSTN